MHRNYCCPVRIAMLVTGILLIVAGAVWTLQGFNSPLAPQSFMTGSVVWIVIGVASIAAGTVLIRRSTRPRQPHPREPQLRGHTGDSHKGETAELE